MYAGCKIFAEEYCWSGATNDAAHGYVTALSASEAGVFIRQNLPGTFFSKVCSRYIVAVCCSVLLCCSVLQCAAVCCCVAVCCSVLQCVAAC